MYIWIDGTGEHLRAKTKTVDFIPDKPSRKYYQSFLCSNQFSTCSLIVFCQHTYLILRHSRCMFPIKKMYSKIGFVSLERSYMFALN